MLFQGKPAHLPCLWALETSFKCWAFPDVILDDVTLMTSYRYLTHGRGAMSMRKAPCLLIYDLRPGTAGTAKRPRLSAANASYLLKGQSGPSIPGDTLVASGRAAKLQPYDQALRRFK